METRDPIELLRGWVCVTRANGLGPLGTNLAELDEIADEIEAAYMKLPVDADGVPIRPGDIMRFRDDAPVRVDSIGNNRWYEGDYGWFGGNGGFYGSGTLRSCRHVKPETVEDIIAEVYHLVREAEDECGLIADYAERIRKAVEHGN